MYSDMNLYNVYFTSKGTGPRNRANRSAKPSRREGRG